MQEAYGFIHCHSEHSLNDSPMSIEEMVKTAKSFGAVAISLTDHGTMTGVIEFIETCNKYEIKPIVGVEAYVSDDDDYRSHLIILAKNYDGYREICKAVTESNKNLIPSKYDKDLFYPVMTKKVISALNKDNVIVTSACISGVIASIFIRNKNISDKIKKLEEKKKDYDCGELTEVTSKVDNLNLEIKEKASKKDELTPISKRAFTKKIKGVESLKNTDPQLYITEKEKLNLAIAETNNAKTEIEKIKKELAALKRKRTLENKKLTDLKKKNAKCEDLDDQINELKSALLSSDELIEKSKAELLWYKHLFGNSFYAEMQYHGMPDEAYVMPIIADLAKQLDIPLLATNDIHIAKISDVKARQLIKSLRFNKWEEISVADKELYFKSDKELSATLSQILPEAIVSEAMANIKVVCDSCTLIIPNEKHYPKYRDSQGNSVTNPAELLIKRTFDGVKKRGFTKRTFTQEYLNRTKYELDTIIKMGFADYLLIVADFINYGKEISKQNEYGIGFGVGPGRGSAAGSIVCFFLGITNINPIKYHLKFERFLNPSRQTMPDIDTDFAHEIRMKVVDYVSEKYGKESVAMIRTKQLQKAKASIRNVARLHGLRDKDDKTVYYSIGDQICKTISDKANSIDPDKILENVTDQTTIDIVNDACLIEKTMANTSIHAAGVIIGDGKPLSEYIPLLYNTNLNQWAVQCDKDEAERIGLLKMDFLGLTTLDILSECIRRIKRYTGKTIDLNELPFDDKVFSEIFSKGKTKCVFQFESEGMISMLKQFKPQSYEDIILAVSVYRPGPMDFIPKIIDVKSGLTKPTYCIPELASILDPTYGYPIYQEQLMDIFSVCVGFTSSEADNIRRLMSKKKTEQFMRNKPKFIKGLVEKGASMDDAEALWSSLVSFAEYAFNKSHAAAYAWLSYLTAYLKYYYPEYYMCSLLNHKDNDSISGVLEECLSMGIKIQIPDINTAYSDFENTNDGIIFGLSKIKGVKAVPNKIISERKENGRYKNYKDLLMRTSISYSSLEKLIDAGSLDSFKEGSRDALKRAGNILCSLVEKKNANEKVLISLENKERTSRNEKRILEVQNSLKKIIRLIDTCFVDRSIHNSDAYLQKEYELLGAYVSAHPLDQYRKVYEDKEITLISELSPSIVTCIGCIRNLRIVHRKADHKRLAFFELEDISGRVKVNCFTAQYEKYSYLIKENNVVSIRGECFIEPDYFTETDVYKINLLSISKCTPKKSSFFVSIPDKSYETTAYYMLKEYEDEKGHPILLHYQNTGNIEPKKLKVSPKALQIDNEDFVLRLSSVIF